MLFIIESVNMPPKFNAKTCVALMIHSAAMLMTTLTLALTLIQSFCLIAISDFMVNKKFKLNDGKSHLRKKKESKQYCNSNKNYSSLLGAWIHQDIKCGVAQRPL